MEFKINPVNIAIFFVSFMLSFLWLFFVEINEDTLIRYYSEISFDLSLQNLAVLVFREPFTALISSYLNSNNLSPIYLQYILFSIIFFFAYLILKTRLYFFPILLLVPTLSLLAFNIQSVMIAGLINYYILSDEQNKNNSYTKNLILWIFSLGFHWSAVIFLPVILIQKRYFKSLVLFLFLAFLFLMFFSETILIGAILQKFSDYQNNQGQGGNSIFHIQVLIFVTTIFLIANVFLRINNFLYKRNYLYLFLISIIFFIFFTIGVKAASRFAFLLDIFIFFDLIKFWIPSAITRDFKFRFSQ